MRKTLYITTYIILAVCLTERAFAETDSWQNSPLQVNASRQATPADSGTYVRGLTVNQDDITPEQTGNNIQLTAAQMHQALVWGLTPEQEQRYINLMQNKSGLQYQGLHLSPVWILGLNARDDTERAYFAKLAAEQEERYVAGNLAWNQAYTQAYRDLTAGLPVIKPFDVSQYSPVLHQNVVWQQQDIVNLFITATDAVGEILANIMAALSSHPDMKLNVFFVGNANPTAIQAWANEQSIPTTWVISGRVTLNDGNTQYAHLAILNKKTPLLVLVRNNQAHLIDTGVL
ncbi:MAG: TIGR03759 family integrating conjugative element protein [Gammaproteobacteria bacterium]